MSHARTGMPEEEKSDERIIEAVGRTRVNHTKRQGGIIR